MSASVNRLQKLLGMKAPILCAPMTTSAGASLAAQVTLGGGFGFIGTGTLTPERLAEELECARVILGADKGAPLRIGAGFIGWVLDKDEEAAQKSIQLTLDSGVYAICFSFGNDLYKWIQVVRRYDAENDKKTVILVQLGLQADIQTAIRDWKVDIVIAQGQEAGGHAFIGAPGIRELVSWAVSVVPKDDGPLIVGAGGLATGEEIAEILNLGAAGVLLGTRFCLTNESIYPEISKRALLAANSEASVKSVGFDQIMNFLVWPKNVDGRALRNASLDEFEKGEDIEIVRSKSEEGFRTKDLDRLIVWAGAGVGKMNDIKPAKELVEELYRDCQAHLRVKSN